MLWDDGVDLLRNVVVQAWDFVWGGEEKLFFCSLVFLSLSLREGKENLFLT